MNKEIITTFIQENKFNELLKLFNESQFNTMTYPTYNNLYSFFHQHFGENKPKDFFQFLEDFCEYAQSNIKISTEKTIQNLTMLGVDEILIPYILRRAYDLESKLCVCGLTSSGKTTLLNAIGIVNPIEIMENKNLDDIHRYSFFKFHCSNIETAKTFIKNKKIQMNINYILTKIENNKLVVNIG